MSDSRVAVVVVDDAPEVRTVVRLQLGLSDHFAVVAEGASGREAVELALRHQPAILLLDASMPDMDGLQAVPEIRAASPATRIVMLSGFDAVSLERRALELGVCAYIEKSRPISELPERLLALLDGTEERAEVVAPTAVDTSGGVDAEAVLAEHLERFRTVFDQAAIGMATLTLTGSIVRANRALAHLAGHTSEEALVGLHYTDLADPDDADAVAAALGRAGARREGAEELDHRVRGGEGARWAHSTLAAVRDTQGRRLYLFAQAEDITRRREAIEELRVSEERFRLMVESVQDYAIFMLDPDGHVTTWNLGAERMKGYAASEIIGRHFSVFYPDEARERRHPDHELEIARRDGRYEEEGWRIRKDGSSFWANVVITALVDDGRLVGFAKVTRDMTERRRAQMEREEFLAITAHELQSPVTAITGSADILDSYWDVLGEDERRDTLRRISAGGARIRRLLTDLLTASRLDAGSFDLVLGPVPLAPVVEQALAEVATVVPVVDVVGIEGVTVEGDATRLVQILTNLLVNAGKYGRPPVVLDTRPGPEGIQLRVTDAGDGVPDGVAPRLFEKFARGEGSGNRGTGLGLFIVRELARAQGGDAWYERPEDGGSRFVIALRSPR